MVTTAGRPSGTAAIARANGYNEDIRDFLGISFEICHRTGEKIADDSVVD